MRNKEVVLSLSKRGLTVLYETKRNEKKCNLQDKLKSVICEKEVRNF